MGVNDYFVLILTNKPHVTPNYGSGKYSFEIDY